LSYEVLVKLNNSYNSNKEEINFINSSNVLKNLSEMNNFQLAKEDQEKNNDYIKINKIPIDFDDKNLSNSE
jgi:hypothetical protein